MTIFGAVALSSSSSSATFFSVSLFSASASAGDAAALAPSAGTCGPAGVSLLLLLLLSLCAEPSLIAETHARMSDFSALVAEFIGITACDAPCAAACLRAHGNSLERAVGAYLDGWRAPAAAPADGGEDGSSSSSTADQPRAPIAPRREQLLTEQDLCFGPVGTARRTLALSGPAHGGPQRCVFDAFRNFRQEGSSTRSNDNDNEEGDSTAAAPNDDNDGSENEGEDTPQPPPLPLQHTSPPPPCTCTCRQRETRRRARR